MKRLTKTLSVFLIILFISACGNNFLSVKPKDIVSNNNFFKTESQAQSSLIGAYAQLQSEHTFGNITVANFDWAMSGDLFEQDKNTARVQLETLSLPSDNTYITDMYTALYKGVRRANYTISGVKKMDNLDSKTKKLIIAQARYLRGMYYYELVHYYGGVPLILKPLKANDNLNQSRDSWSDCWVQIEKDFNFAAENLPDVWEDESDKGRATKGAALEFLVKSYLWQKEWDKAIKASQKIINSGVYHLLDNYRSVFNPDNPDNKEIVFSTQYSLKQNGAEGTQLTTRSAPRGQSSKYVGHAAWSNFAPATNWINSFETDSKGRIIDKRYWASVIGPGQKHPNMDYVQSKDWPNVSTRTGYILIKYWFKSNPTKSGIDAPIIRYAEVLLNYANALAMDGRTSEAMKQVNIIRKRAGLESKPLNLSKDKVMDAIFHEARMGFIWEPYGAFSMLNRAGRFMDFIKVHKHDPDYNTLNAEDKPWLHKKPILLPIPKDAWNVNKELTQNPGYAPFE